MGFAYFTKFMDRAVTELWTGAFGNAYTKRQPSNTQARMDMWRAVFPPHQHSVLEVGANVGANLDAIAAFSAADLYAAEPNDLARELIEPDLCAGVTNDSADKLSFADNSIDLVFTCGVLIHVPPDKLKASLSEIHRVAGRYIIAAEYFAPQEEMIPYRGHDDALWRRDYGGLYLDQFPDLKCTSCTFAWKRTTGLDNLTIWLFEKGRNN